MARMTNEGLAEMIGGLAKEMTHIKGAVDKMEKGIAEANGRQRGDHDKITGLETKLGIWGGAQAIFTTVAAIIAGLIGIQR